MGAANPSSEAGIREAIMDGYNLIIDVARCENCNNCVLANKDEFVGNDFPGYSAPQTLHGESTLKISRNVRGSGHMVDTAYVPTMCNHCDNAPCIKAAGPGVINKRDDGIVIIDPIASVGRKDLLEACPYGAIVWNEELNIPQNWIFDAQLLDHGWSEPRCEHSCPTKVFETVKTDDATMARRAADEKLEVLSPEWKTKPRVYYKNLYRSNSFFVGGSVVAKLNGQKECIEGAEVKLLFSGDLLQTARTDIFGDFKFDGLTKSSGQYTIEISNGGLTKKSIAADTGKTVFLGQVELG
jgi:Fe-S-cluster-containing dehydrogenase component